MRNEADNSVYRSEKMLRENAEKINANDKSRIEKAVNEVKEALKGSDTAALKSTNDKLTEAWQAVSAELYRAAAEKRGQAEGTPPRWVEILLDDHPSYRQRLALAQRYKTSHH